MVICYAHAKEMHATDTAPIRPGEELNIPALQAYLTGKIAGAENGIELEQFPGGHSNLTYLLRAGENEYVLRRGPLGPVAPKAHDMAREFHVLQAVHPHFAPAPNVHVLCEDPAVIGGVFFIMERRRGVIVRTGIPEEFAKLPGHARSISEAFVNCLANLHAVDIEQHGLIQLGKPEGFLERQVKGWAGRWYRAQTSPLPDMDRVIGWLESTMPTPLSPTLVHNDFKLDNMMFASGDPSKVVAVLDWEMTTVGDPLVDVGLTLCYWQLGSVSAQPTAMGLFSREEFLQHYAQRTGRDLSRVDWYEVLGMFKLAVILQQIFYRYHNGQTQDVRFKDFDQRVAGLVGQAVELLEKTV